MPGHNTNGEDNVWLEEMQVVSDPFHYTPSYNLHTWLHN
jgi:hypothetical protein